MIKYTLAICILTVMLPCHSQNNEASEKYTQKLEYGIHGNVKEVISQVYKIKNNEIKTDSSNLIYTKVMEFDREGNVLRLTRLVDFDSIRQKTIAIFKGQGADLSYIETVEFSNLEKEKSNYKYVWKDALHYAIVCAENESFVNEITLNSDYKIIKSVFKSTGYENTETLSRKFENNKLLAINSISKTYLNNEINTTETTVQTVKEYDKYNNPTRFEIKKNASDGYSDFVISIIKYTYY